VPIASPTVTASESDLIRHAQEGDVEAFGLLFEKHKARVYALCLRMTRNTAEAEDLTQEAFLHVFRKLAAFRADSALSTWLYRVTVNTVLMHFRKKTLCVVSVERLSNDGGSVPREFPGTDFRLTGCIDRMALNRALAELPHGYRKIFLLHEVAGYEHREIAGFLGCSVGNSKSQLHKARQRIRELLVNSGPAQAARSVRNGVELKPQPARQWKSSYGVERSRLPQRLPTAPVVEEQQRWAGAA
jgi:RNA polymerase sigma-70 factor, ECF subfamily